MVVGLPYGYFYPTSTNRSVSGSTSFIDESLVPRTRKESVYCIHVCTYTTVDGCSCSFLGRGEASPSCGEAEGRAGEAAAARGGERG